MEFGEEEGLKDRGGWVSMIFRYCCWERTSPCEYLFGMMTGKKKKVRRERESVDKERNKPQEASK